MAADFDITQYLRKNIAVDMTDSPNNDGDNDEEGAREEDSINLHLLEVVAARFSDGHYLEDQDMFNLSGIFRDVLLYTLPSRSNTISIAEYNWRSEYDDASGEAQILVDLFVKQRKTAETVESAEAAESGTNDCRHALQVCLFNEGLLVSTSYPTSVTTADAASAESGSSWGGNKDGNDRFNPPCPTLKFQNSHVTESLCRASVPILHTQCTSGNANSMSAAEEDAMRNHSEDGCEIRKMSVTLQLPAAACHLWSAETPYVYTLVVSLLDLQPINAQTITTTAATSSTVLQSESCYVGLRTVRISPATGVLTVNSRALMVRGVNLHEHDPVFGHTITPQLLEADVLLMKRHNFNAVRTSHYPQQPWFYQLCTGDLSATVYLLHLGCAFVLDYLISLGLQCTDSSPSLILHFISLFDILPPSTQYMGCTY